MPYQVEMIICR